MSVGSHPESEQQQHRISTSSLFSTLPSDAPPQLRLVCYLLDRQPHLIPPIRKFLEEKLAATQSPPSTIWKYLQTRFPSCKSFAE